MLQDRPVEEAERAPARTTETQKAMALAQTNAIASPKREVTAAIVAMASMMCLEQPFQPIPPPLPQLLPPTLPPTLPRSISPV